MLKEVEITAFGKRVKLANAIAELRRPPSIMSYTPHSMSGQSVSGSVRGVSGSYSMGNGSGYPMGNMGMGMGGGMPYSPESAPHTGDLMGTPIGMGGFSDMRGGVSTVIGLRWMLVCGD